MGDRKIDIESWKRKGHFEFFTKFSEPFHGMVVDIDCTKLLDYSQKKGKSFFKLYLYVILKSLNQVQEFKLRIRGEEVWELETIHASATIARSDETFGFSFIKYVEDFDVFSKNVESEKERLENEPGLDPTICGDEVIHFSSLPWIKFRSLSHARSFDFPDSCPKISVGKVFDDVDGSKKMPMSIHVHHALVDALPIARFLQILDEEMNRIQL